MGVKVVPAQSVAWDRGDGCGGYGSMFSQRDFRCSVLWAFGDLATAGLAAPVGSGGIKHHISMFPGKQTTFLSPSHGITAVITAVICGASVPSVKVLSSVCYIFRVVYSAVFSPICALSMTEQLPEM